MSNIVQRGIPEVPLDPTNPKSAEEVRQFLVNLRQTVVDLRGPKHTPTAPSNFKVTPMAFANLLQWTSGVDADGTNVFWNSKPTLSGAVQVDVGGSQQHVDYVGNSGVTRYYWIQSYDAHSQFHSSVSIEVGPLSGATLASGTGVNVPPPPPSGQQQVMQTTTGQTVSKTQPGRGKAVY